MRLVSRDYRTSCWLEVELRGDLIESVRHATGPDRLGPEDPWIAPAFWDIQTNGRGGISFSSPDLSVEQVAAVVRDQQVLGTARLCPTLITAPVDHMLHGLRTIAAACERIPDVGRRVLGIHVEGPFLSELEGYRGAASRCCHLRSELAAVRSVPAGRGRTYRALYAGTRTQWRH